MKISLIGFMGTGKSSIGKELAMELNYNFIDTDNKIEKETGISIPEIFSLVGEEYFRELEKKTLSKILSQEGNLVVATGGGIVLSSENRKSLKQYTLPVLLVASPGEIRSRINIDGRPLLASAPDPLERIKKMLKKRASDYNQFKNRIITDGKTPEEIVKEIIKLVESEYHGKI